MALSNELVKQFAEITNDAGPQNTETTVYGTIVEVEDGLYAKIDGSDTLTPVTTTVKVKDGHRVTISLKNHTATVTGNLSDPSAYSIIVDEFGIHLKGYVSIESVANGTTTIDGSCIKTGTIDAARINLTSVVKSQFSTNGTDDWHEEMVDSDYYRKDSMDGGNTWTKAYQFRGKNGSDASVPAYIRNTYIDATKVESFYLKGNKIEAVIPKTTEGDTDTGFMLTGTFTDINDNLIDLCYLRIWAYDSGIAPYTHFGSPDGAYAYWDFGMTRFAGTVEFLGDVIGVTATFA